MILYAIINDEYVVYLGRCSELALPSVRKRLKVGESVVRIGKIRATDDIKIGEITQKITFLANEISQDKDYQKTYHRQYREKHGDYLRERSRDYQRKHVEEIKTQRKERYIKFLQTDLGKSIIEKYNQGMNAREISEAIDKSRSWVSQLIQIYKKEQGNG